MNLRAAEQLADAVMYEGYVLYPYRASAAKNQFRWQIGLVVPRVCAEAGGSDPWFMQTECLVEPSARPVLTVKARALQVQQRLVEEPLDSPGGAWRSVPAATVGDNRLIAWEEGVERECLREGLPLDPAGGPWEVPFNLPGGVDVEPVRDETGRVAARLVRRREPVLATLHIAVERCEPLLKLRLRLENLSDVDAARRGDRISAVRHALAGAHLLLGIEGGRFVSLLEPPEGVAHLASRCVNQHTWPVLVGARDARSMILSAPIIMYDYPAVAPESQGDHFDATEIDELLMLRLKTLTDDEKREARATDDRARHVVDRAETATADTLRRLHGAVRPFGDAPREEADPADAVITVGEERIAAGSRVRLKPARAADSLDLCLSGRLATVVGVYRTLENTPYVAVVPVDDPLHDGEGRYRRALFFRPDEIEPVGVDDASGAQT